MLLCSYAEMCLTFTVLLPVIWEHAHAQGRNCNPKLLELRNDVAVRRKMSYCNSALLAPHHKHAGSWSSLIAASPLSRHCTVSWLQGCSSPPTPALAPSLVLLPPLTNFSFCVNASFLSVTDVCSALIFPLEFPTHCAISLLFCIFPSSSVHKIGSVLAAFHAPSSTGPNL